MPQRVDSPARISTVKLLIIAAATVIALIVGYSAVYRAGPHQFGEKTWGSPAHRSDFTAYRAAGEAVLAGTNIYEAHNVRGWYFTALPIFALVMVPCAMLSVFWSSLIWYLLSVAMFAHMIWMAARLARRSYQQSRLDEFWIGALAALLVLRPVISGLARGQPSLLGMYLATLAIWLACNYRSVLAGFALAGSVVLKIFPALLLVYFIARRRWTVASASIGWLALLVVIIPAVAFGWQGNQSLLIQWVDRIGMPASDLSDSTESQMYEQLLDPRIPRNQSVSAVVTRLIAGNTAKTAAPEREAVAGRLALAINAAMVLVSVLVFWRRCAKADDAAIALEASVVLLLMLLVSPVVWTHYYAGAVLPLAMCVAMAGLPVDSRNRRAARVALVVYGLCVVLSMIIQPLQLWGAMMFATMAIWAALLLPEQKTAASAAPERTVFAR